MFKKVPPILLLAILLFLSGCRPRVKEGTATRLDVSDAPKEQLLSEVNRFAKVNSMRAKMDFQFVDNSAAHRGSKETYTKINSEIVVQRPANIFLKVEILTVDIAQMTSNGEKFRLAVLRDNSGGKYKKFVLGTNNADYSKLQNNLSKDAATDAQSVNTFANLRPQHITDAMLVRPTDAAYIYLQSAINQLEEDESQGKNSPLRIVMRGYYLLDELKKGENEDLKVVRRFWFDRVGEIRLARQQLFDAKGEIESDIVYGAPGNLGATGEYNNLPLRIQVTRPKEKYTIILTYQSPASIAINNRSYGATIFELKNTWGLQEVNLDDELLKANGSQSAISNQ